MGADSAIQWCHHTFNPWRGCTHVSPGCENCYAEALSRRNPAQLGTWGAGGTRVVAAESYWRQPLRWDRAAEAAGERHRVFCASLADVFEDRPELVEPRARLWRLIVATPHLDWLLLTKRIENVQRMTLGWLIPPNLWLGTTVEDQRRADERIPILLDTPAAVRFLSCEPLLGPVDLSASFRQPCPAGCGCIDEDDPDRLDCACDGPCCMADGWPGPGLDWLIVGGESGPRARPMDLAWARSLVEQGRAAGVPVFVKQMGSSPYGPDDRITGRRYDESLGPRPQGFSRYLNDSHGGDPDEWPLDLRVREFPREETT